MNLHLDLALRFSQRRRQLELGGGDPLLMQYSFLVDKNGPGIMRKKIEQKYCFIPDPILIQMKLQRCDMIYTGLAKKTTLQKGTDFLRPPTLAAAYELPPKAIYAWLI